VFKENTAASLRRLAAPVRIGARRVTARPTAFVLAAAGVVLAACALATISAASLVVKDRAVGRAIAELPPDQRAVRVTWVGVSTVPADSAAALDRQVRAALQPVGIPRPTAVLLYRDTRFGKQVVRLGAVDGLARAVELTSGRFPRSCRPGRCEVVAIGKVGAAAPGFVVTGRGSLRSDPAGSFFESVARSGRLRLAAGVESLARLPSLESSFRTYGWVAPLGSHDVRGWDVDGFRARIDRASTGLEASSPNFALSAPTVALADAGAKSRIAGRRLLLVGGQAVALLLAFVLLAATRLRRGARASARRLDSFGATGAQTRLAALAEAALVVVPATLLGWLLGAVAALVLADATDSPAGAVVSRSVASSTAVELMLAVAVLGTLVLYLGSRARAVAIGGLTVSIADVAAAGALVAVLVAFAVGGADAESLATSEGTGITLLLLPGLIALVTAVVIARLLQPALRACERAAAGRSVAVKLALLSLARAPGTATIAIVFVSVSVGLALFAAVYRSTLIRNDADRAAFEVPLDYTVKKNPRFVSHATPVGAAYQAAFDAVPVVRLQGEAPSLDRRGVALLGVPATDLSRLHWRGDFASESQHALGERIGGPPVRLHGARLPATGRELRLPVTIRGDPIHLSVNVQTRNGRFVLLDLGEPVNTGKPTVARAPIPASARGGRLIGLLIEFSRAEEFGAAHRETGKAPTFAVFRAGVLRIRRPLVAGPGGTRPLPVDYRNWVGAKGARPTNAGSLALRYLLTQDQVFRLRPSQPTDNGPIPVIASASLARAVGDAVLPLYVGTALVKVRIAGTARRFPTTSGDFVVADRSRLETALNAAAPGSAVADEAWVAGPPGLKPKLLQRPPTPVRVTSRRAVEQELRSDPLARGSLLVLAAAGLVALALSLVGLALTVAVELRDEDGELFDLETQGMGPSALRQQVRLRAGAVLLAGLFGGLALGAVLALVVLKALAVSANSTEPVPPLVLAPDWPALLLGCALFVALALAVVALLTRTAFREQIATPSAEAV
jgi:FtsX-like permease family protein